MNSIQITGTAFLGADFRPENVELTINNGIITDISPAREISGKLILPAFFNAHTHIGDTVALDTPIDRPLKELVAPPNGLKHVILRETPNDKLISAMRHSMEFMIRGGTTGFAALNGTKFVALQGIIVPVKVAVNNTAIDFLILCFAYASWPVGS